MKYIIANWKMNFNRKDIRQWFNIFGTRNLRMFHDKVIMVAPSHPYLQETKDCCEGKPVFVCAQDVDIHKKGAHTGAVGAYQIKDFCEYAVVGHSERKEDLDTVVKKRDICLENDITPVVCFSEVNNILKLYTDGVILAWEDPKNISQGGVYREKNPAEVFKGIDEIRKIIPQQAELIYGGSVNKENIKDLALISGIDGVLPGNASLDPDHYYDIIMQA